MIAIQSYLTKLVKTPNALKGQFNLEKYIA